MKLIRMVMAVASLLVVTTGTGMAAQPTPGAEYKSNELIIKYREGAGVSAGDDLHRRYGSQRITEFKPYRLEHVKMKAGRSLQEAIAAYEADPGVEYAEPNYIVHKMVVPYDRYWNNLWGMNRINAADAWDSSIGNPAVVIGTIDTGVDYNHPDLIANIWTGADGSHGYNAITHTYNPLDDAGHGTHIAGTIGATGNNGIGVVGINWQVKIMACKFLDSTGSGSITGAIDCLNYFKNQKNAGVNIVATNNSWGGVSYSQALYDVINAQQDILFVAAAGNNATNNDTTASYPANYELPNIIAVAATDSVDALASFSQYGRRTVDVAAPGVNIYSTLRNGSYGYYSGTSMATPHVTGLAGLIKAKNPDADWRMIKNLILSSGDNVLALSTKTVTGKRINAYNALTCADSRVMSAIRYPATFTIGSVATLSALSINCGSSAGPVTVTISSGEAVVLNDEGIPPDMAAGDGRFTALFTPTRSVESMVFLSPAGTETISYLPPPLSVSVASLSGATAGVAYSANLIATGGVIPYSWSLAAGVLPAGLSLSSSGIISGTPTTVGTYGFTVKVTDSKATVATKTLGITVIAPVAKLAVVTSLLPAATRKIAYKQTLSAAGGTAPYLWSISSGTLPSGLSLTALTGIISGTPRFAGTSVFSVTVKDAKGVIATKSLSIKVN